MTYQPPRSVLEVLKEIEFEKALTLNDPRFVDTRAARGSEKTLSRLARKFGLDLATGQFVPTTQKHVLFFGHTGSGKTTELRHYAKELSGPKKYLVIEVDISLELDLHNVQYADTLMAMAKFMLLALTKNNVSLPAGALTPLESWFSERVLSAEDAREFSALIEAGGGVKGSIPYLISVFTKFTAAFKTNATYKDSIRKVIRNNFADFSTAFNGLLRDAESALSAAGIATRILFVVDGTDKLRSEDRRNFFVQDAEQLLAIDTHVIYSAPLSLKYESNLTNRLDADLVLPMIKLNESDDTVYVDGPDAMVKILLLRADRNLFASDAEVKRLVEMSGGHPREMLRLLKLCCEFAEDNSINAATVAAAIKQLAADYRRFLEPEDFAVLVKVDREHAHAGNDERKRKLLYNLALLEYNDGGWQRSHPVVRTLEGYRRAADALAAQPV